jgi:hypothetical protein
MERHHESRKLPHILSLGAAVALLSSCAGAPSTQNSAGDKIVETNITNNLYLSSGEPEIAVDPRNPRNLAVIEFAIGSGTMRAPSSATNPLSGATDPAAIVAQSTYDGRVMLSRDGGDHWVQSGTPPASDPKSRVHGGGDPMIAIGPDGTIYAADETPPASTGEVAASGPRVLAEYLSHFNVMITASRDRGHTFSAPQIAGTPADRPWMVVDQSTGMVYTVSSGPLNVTTGVHNVAGPDAPNDRWLVAWQPHLAGRSEPRRLGGPDFSGSGGSTLTAAHGVVAATFVLGGPTPGAGFTGAPPAPVPVPASLQSALNGAVTSCSIQAPCLFFETSSDQGQHWARHHVVVPGGFSGQHANVSADPGRPGRYAISVLTSDRTKFLVLVTDDSGATWSRPVTILETASGVNFKQWMAYGPTGVLGLVWRKERSDLTPAKPPNAPPESPLFPSTGPAYDVYAAISCDGGATWLPTTRVNAETSPAGPPGRDDFSFIALDARYAHLVWGDHRMPTDASSTPSPANVIQAYYGRVPFSALSKGAACGRR